MPEKLLPTDFLDLSGKTVQRILFANIPRRVPGAARPALCFWDGNRFPEHARGFLYLHQEINDPMKSSIRLRCTRSNDPASFNLGKDLARSPSETWAISMPTILHSRSSDIRDYLLHAEFLTDHQIVHWQSSQKFPSPRGPRKYSPVLSTLKPDELLPSDFVDMSYKGFPTISFTCNSTVPTSDIATLSYYAGYNSRFPAHARGFLYYHQPLNMPPIAASIRLRCTPSNDPATFNQGEDLLTPIGLPWDVRIPTILSFRSPQIRNYLLHAKIVTDAQMLRWKHALNGKLIRPYHALYRLDQPFLIRFESVGLRLTTIVGDFMGHISLQRIFCDMRGQFSKDGSRRSCPYRGLFAS
jgi:hypothetical protein